MAMILHHIVTEAQNGNTLHEVIRSLGISAQQLVALKKSDGILVDGAFRYANQPVVTGENIQLTFPGYDTRNTAPLGSLPPPKVLYEDDCYLALFKPAGVQSHPSKSAPQTADTMEERVLSNFGYAAHAAHRLDAETQGILMFSKFPYAQTLMHDLMRERKFHKKYEAWLYGIPPASAGFIDEPIERRDPYSFTRIVRPDGKPSRSSYSVIETRFIYGHPVTHVFLSPISGRTHQLRVHMAHIGCPLLGDVRYCTRESAVFQEICCIQDMFLNAWSVDFDHPFTGEHIHIQTPLFRDPFWYVESDEQIRLADYPDAMEAMHV